jgi:hypothetical protein
VRLQLPQGEAGEYLALRPLDREIDETWDRFAIAAADEGISPDVLAEHIYEQGGRVVTGPYSSRYLEFQSPNGSPATLMHACVRLVGGD